MVVSCQRWKNELFIRCSARDSCFGEICILPELSSLETCRKHEKAIKSLFPMKDKGVQANQKRSFVKPQNAWNRFWTRACSLHNCLSRRQYRHKRSVSSFWPNLRILIGDHSYQVLEPQSTRTHRFLTYFSVSVPGTNNKLPQTTSFHNLSGCKNGICSAVQTLCQTSPSGWKP